MVVAKNKEINRTDSSHDDNVSNIHKIKRTVTTVIFIFSPPTSIYPMVN